MQRSCDSSKAATVKRMATPTHLILVTVDTRCQNPKTMTVTWMVTPTRLIPVAVDTFDTPTRCQNPKTMTVTWMVTPTHLILVTVDTFDTPTRCQNPKTMIVTWMVTPTRLILATVDTLDTLTYQRSQSCDLPYLILPIGARVADAEIFVASKNSKRHSLHLPTLPTAALLVEMPLFTVSAAFQEVQVSRTPNIQKHVGACESGFQKEVGLERSTALTFSFDNPGQR